MSEVPSVVNPWWYTYTDTVYADCLLSGHVWDRSAVEKVTLSYMPEFLTPRNNICFISFKVTI